MPFKSQAQRRKFAQLLVEGKIVEQDVRGVESGDRKEETAGARSKTTQRREEALKARPSPSRPYCFGLLLTMKFVNASRYSSGAMPAM